MVCLLVPVTSSAGREAVRAYDSARDDRKIDRSLHGGILNPDDCWEDCSLIRAMPRSGVREHLSTIRIPYESMSSDTSANTHIDWDMPERAKG